MDKLENINSIYMNTQFKILEGHKYLESNTNLAMREISALMTDDSSVNTCYIDTLSRFLTQTGIDCKDLYLYSRKSSHNEVIYDLQHMTNTDIDFSVIIEKYDNEMKAGILIDYPAYKKEL